MSLYEVRMRVTYHEIWTVEANDEAEAIEALKNMTDAVEPDDAGGECIDWDLDGPLKHIKR